MEIVPLVRRFVLLPVTLAANSTEFAARSMRNAHRMAEDTFDNVADRLNVEAGPNGETVED